MIKLICANKIESSNGFHYETFGQEFEIEESHLKKSSVLAGLLESTDNSDDPIRLNCEMFRGDEAEIRNIITERILKWVVRLLEQDESPAKSRKLMKKFYNEHILEPDLNPDKYKQIMMDLVDFCSVCTWLDIPDVVELVALVHCEFFLKKQTFRNLLRELQ